MSIIIFAEEIDVYDFKTLLYATKKTMQENRNYIWVFRKNGVLLDIKNMLLQKELLKYYNYMKKQKTPINFYKELSTSMCKTIIPGQQLLVVQDPNYKSRRNDIVVYYSYSKIPAYSQFTFKDSVLKEIKHSEKIVKLRFISRCVAIGEDEVFMKNKHLFLHPHEGNEYIKHFFKKYKIIKIENQLFIKEPYLISENNITHDQKITRNLILSNKRLKPYKLIDFNLTKIPKNCFFFIGDNREHSIDSRYYGCIRAKDIIGKVVLLKFKNESINNSTCKPKKRKKVIYRFRSSSTSPDVEHIH